MQLFGKSLDGPPLIVAEIGANHGGSIEKAFDLIEAAYTSGADAVKCQCYEADRLTIKSDRPEFIVDSPLWKGRTLWDLYSEAQTPLKWMEPLFRHAADVGIPIFASVFDQESIVELERLKTPAYKIASFEITDIPLIEAVAKTGKPIIISTGMAIDTEIEEAIMAVSHANGTFILHCVSGYPTPVAEAWLSRITWLAGLIFEQKLWNTKNWNVHIGLSDHTAGSIVPIAATALGAKLIEKHFCLSRDDPGPDAKFSMEPEEFYQMALAVREAWKALQPSQSPSQDVNRKYRRSLYVVKDMKAGQLFSEHEVRSIRPAAGLPPKMWPNVKFKRAAMDIPAGTPLTMDMVIGPSLSWESPSILDQPLWASPPDPAP